MEGSLEEGRKDGRKLRGWMEERSTWRKGRRKERRKGRKAKKEGRKRRKEGEKGRKLKGRMEGRKEA